MKITPRPARGMTLLELTVVIVVILSLIGILFIGTEAWRAGANQSGCILNIRNAQTAVRAYQNIRDAKEGDSVTMYGDIIGAGKFLEQAPVCPAAGTYTPINHVPYMGELAITCSLETTRLHEPKNYADW